MIVFDGTPRHYDDKPTRVGSYGVVLKRGVSVEAESQTIFECWLLIDGDCSPTVLWSKQFSVVQDETYHDKVFWLLAEKWIEKLSR